MNAASNCWYCDRLVGESLTIEEQKKAEGWLLSQYRSFNDLSVHRILSSEVVMLLLIFEEILKRVEVSDAQSMNFSSVHFSLQLLIGWL